MGTNLVEERQNTSPPEKWRGFLSCRIFRNPMTPIGFPSVVVTAEDIADAHRAIAEIDVWLTPAPEASILKWLTALYLPSAKAQVDAKTLKAMMRLYCEGLAHLPADLVERALASFRGVYFPALDEIRMPIEESAEYRRRRRLRRAFEACVANNGADPYAERKLDPEERAIVATGFSALAKSLRGEGPK